MTPTALGFGLKAVQLFRVERLPTFYTESRQSQEWDDYGNEKILPLLKKHDIRSYAQLPDSMADFCKDMGSNKKYHKNFITNENDFISFCEGDPFTEDIMRLYYQGREERNRKIFKSNRTAHVAPSLLKQTKYQMNLWFADTILSDLKGSCPTTDKVIPAMQQYMAAMYQGIDLPTDSISKFVSSLDKHLLLAFVKHHEKLMGLSRETHSERNLANRKSLSDKVIKIAFLFAYEDLIGKNDLTQTLIKQSEETRRLWNAAYMAAYKEQTRKEKAEKSKAYREVHKELLTLDNEPVLLWEPNSVRGTHQDYEDWTNDNKVPDSGDSFIQYREETKQSLPWPVHIIPLHPRFHWRKTEDSIQAPGDITQPPSPIVYPPRQLPGEIRELIVNSHKGDPDHWSIHAWFNLFFEGALRHINNSKNYHLD